MPFMMDSRIPGIDSRYSVSSIERQSSSAMSTADVFLSVMWDWLVCVGEKKPQQACRGLFSRL